MSDKSCKHKHFDGGECMKCGKKSLCELCDENEWETRCDICESGRICDECYSSCDICGSKMCTVCINELNLGSCDFCCNKLLCEDCADYCDNCSKQSCSNCTHKCLDNRQ
jgi:hypothetical protein